MNVAEWILVIILSITLFIFLIVGIVLMVRLLGVTDEVKKVIVRGQDIADNANGVVSNVKGLTAVGGTVEFLIDKYINPRLKKKAHDKKEKTETKKDDKEDKKEEA